MSIRKSSISGNLATSGIGQNISGLGSSGQLSGSQKFPGQLQDIGELEVLMPWQNCQNVLSKTP